MLAHIRVDTATLRNKDVREPGAEWLCKQTFDLLGNGISHRLYSLKTPLEQHLSRRTKKLFDLEDKIILYDLTNWAAGGQNSVSGNALVSLFSDYKKESLIWNNTLDLGYGLMKQGKEEMIKTDDKIDFLSKAGMKAADHWFYSALLSLRTQMAPGYDYPDTENAISGFLAPAYLLGAMGMDYQPGDESKVQFKQLVGIGLSYMF